MISARAPGVRATRSATSSILACLLQSTTSSAPSRADSLMRSSKEDARREAGTMIASSLVDLGALGEKSGDSTSTLCSSAECDGFWRIFLPPTGCFIGRSVLRGGPLVESRGGVLEVGGQGLVGDDGNPDEEGEPATGEALGEVALVRVAHRHVGEAPDGAEDAAAVDSVADRQGAAALERVGQPGDVPDVLDELPCSSPGSSHSGKNERSPSASLTMKIRRSSARAPRPG